jgi:hypothetical protein
MIRAVFVIAFVMIAAAANADGQFFASKEGVAIAVFRDPDKAVVCLSTRAPVHLSGEYGIHASWTGGAPSRAKPVDLYDKNNFVTPVRLELPLPADARAMRVEVGACVENESCDMVEFNTDLKRLKVLASAAPTSCER